MQFFDPSQRIGQSLAFHLVQKCVIYAALQSQYGHFLTHAHRTISAQKSPDRSAHGWHYRQTFRTLCYEMGAGLTVSEMMSSNPQVWESDKSRLRMVHIDEPGIRTVQIAGSDPKEMADAARINVESGAQIIDINMGCPAKK